MLDLARTREALQREGLEVVTREFLDDVLHQSGRSARYLNTLAELNVDLLRLEEKLRWRDRRRVRRIRRRLCDVLFDRV